MWQYTCTAAAIVGLPLFLFKHSMNDQGDQDEDEEMKDEAPRSRQMPQLSFLSIQRKGLWQRVLISSATYAGILALFYNYSPQITADATDEEKGGIKGLRILFSMALSAWRWKMTEMTLSGKQFFVQNNITKAWQAVLCSVVLPSRIDYNPVQTKQLSTRKKAFLHLLEFIGFGGVISLVGKYVLKNPNIDVLKLPIVVQALLMLVLGLGVPMLYNAMSIATGLLLGNRVHIRYCYSFPFLSLSMKDIWKRWSIQVGEPLRNYIYLPLGGKTNPLFASAAVFAVNCVDHILLAEGGSLPDEDRTPIRVGYAKSFTVIAAGTALDMWLYSRFVKRQKASTRRKLVNVLRYGLMWSTLIGQVVWCWDELCRDKLEFYSVDAKAVE